MRILVIVLLAALVSVESSAQPLELVPSTLVVPQKYQKYFDSTRTLNLPRGFTMSVYATGSFSVPRFLEFNPQGVLCIADDSYKTVMAMPDKDSDGVADTIYEIAAGTEGAHDIAFYGGGMLAGSPNHVWHYDNPSSTGIYSSKHLFIDSIGAAPEGVLNHNLRTMLIDEASKSLYIGVGAPCNACREKDTTRATIQRYSLEGLPRELYATGMRNATGLAMDSSHQLWAAVADRNDQGQDLPSDYVTRVTRSGFYGWPLAFGNQQWVDLNVDSEYKAMLPTTAADTARVASTLPPDVPVAAHSTPLGLIYCKNPNLPAYMDNTLLVSIHGSYPGPTGRFIANGSKIMLISNIGGKWTAQDFLTGLLTDSVNYGRWARPCGLVMDRKGNIYFSSDHTAPHVTPAVYRISFDPKNAVEPALPSPGLLDITQEAGGWNLTVHSTEHASILLYDMLGRRVEAHVSERSVSVDGRSFYLDATEMQHGVYWVVVQCGGERVARRIVQ